MVIASTSLLDFFGGTVARPVRSSPRQGDDGADALTVRALRAQHASLHPPYRSLLPLPAQLWVALRMAL